MLNTGGCSCGNVKYKTIGEPLITTICYCRFCQRATGSGYAIEPIFLSNDLVVISGKAKTYSHTSSGSGSKFFVNFCPDCGTKLYVTFERWPDQIAVYGGTYDEPDWFEMTPKNTQHIFVGEARSGTIIPPGYKTFQTHAFQNDGTIKPRVIYAEPLVIK